MSAKIPTIETKIVIDEINGLLPSKFKSDTVHLNLSNFFQKKIKFSSAFDHKGSRQFLHSKKAALEKIVMDDNSHHSSNNDSDTQNESDKQKIKLKKTKKQKKQVKSSNNLIFFSNNLLNNKNQRKSTSIKYNTKSNLIKTSVTKNLHLQKKYHKYSSSLELKMFKDKEIKKIKPIKKISNFFD